jgi:hypothetical protein
MLTWACRLAWGLIYLACLRFGLALGFQILN